MSEKRDSVSPEVEGIKNIEQRFWKASPDAKAPWIVNTIAVAVHPGGIKTVTPLVNEFVLRGSNTLLITGDVATDITKNQKFLKEPEVITGWPVSRNSIFSQKSLNLFLVSDSGGPEMKFEIEMTLQAIQSKREFGNTIICCMEDATTGLMGNLLALDQHGVDLGKEIDALFMSERQSARTYTDEAFLNIPHEKFITTGPTSWDALRTENTREVNLTKRKEMDIGQDALVVTHLAARGHGLWSEMEIDTTPVVIQAVTKLARNHPDRKIVCLYRFHPGDSQPEILSRLIANSLPCNLPENLKFIVAEPHQTIKEDSVVISATSDVVTSAYSTALTGVALRGARRLNYTETGQMPIYYLSPAVREQIALSHYDIPASVQEGAAAFSDTPDGLVSTMEKAIFDNKFRQDVFTHQANELRNRYRFKGVETAVGRSLMQIRYLLRRVKIWP